MATKILCIDDDQDVINVCKKVLTLEGYDFDHASDGEAGYRKAKDMKPDLIILDVMMGNDTEGFHAAYKFRQDDELKYTPILMMTSVNQKLDFNFNKKRDREFLPVDEFLEKPVNLDMLVVTVKKLLALKKEQVNIDGSK
ncbi:MAG: response regulator [Oligoflexia bacterium]|nr:response regulator [Oligoflexia bacterium]